MTRTPGVRHSNPARPSHSRERTMIATARPGKRKKTVACEVGNKRADPGPLFCFSGRFGAKGLDNCLVGFEIRASDQVNAIRHGGKDRVEALPDRRRFSRKIDDQAGAANAGRLPGENSCRHILQADLPHEFSETRHHFLTDRLRCFRRHVPGSRTGTAGGDDKAAAFFIGQVDERLGNQVLFIRYHPVHGRPMVFEVLAKRSQDGLAGNVFVDPGAGPVGDVDDPDLYV